MRLAYPLQPSQIATVCLTTLLDQQLLRLIQITLLAKPLFHGGFEPIQRHSHAYAHQPIGHWKGIVENGIVGEVAHGKTIEPLERAEECISIFVVGYFDLPGKHSLCGVCPSQSQSQPPSDALEISQYLPGVRKPMAMEKTPYEPPLFTMRQERKAMPSGQLDSPSLYA